MKAPRTTTVIALVSSIAPLAFACGEDEEFFRQTSGLGSPLPGLTQDQLASFLEGEEEFQSQETPADGVGPIFNDNSCVNCHDRGAVGGGSRDLELRFGRTTNGVFDPLVNQGGSLRQDDAIGRAGACFFRIEGLPSGTNTLANRRTTPLFGLGLVDVLPDSTFTSLAASQPASVRGRANMVFNIRAGRNTVGKFGWKAQVPSLFQFSGDAYNNEMGITSPDFPLENCPNQAPDCPDIARCDPVPGVDDDGEDVDLFFEFMRFLAPAPRGPVGAAELRGQQIFGQLGCATCHNPSFTTPSSQSLPAAVRGKTFSPYSDFLLHDMGSLGDGIGAQGIAAPREMRTAPLWGIRFVETLLHDGRVTSITAAILQHAGQGTAARNAFAVLSSQSKADLEAFVRSL